MPLDQAQTTKIQTWLNTKGATASCTTCNRNNGNWELGMIVAAPEFSDGGLSIGGPSVPMVQVICGNCGYVRLFAAVKMGLLS